MFSRLGYEGASNRVLASTAGVNQALIAYHFGSKQGLYLAVFDEIARRVGSRVDALACSLEGSLELGRLDPPSAASRELARNGIPSLLCRHVRLVTMAHSSTRSRVSSRAMCSNCSADALFSQCRLYPGCGRSRWPGRYSGQNARLTEQTETNYHEQQG